ncbi:MAG: DNA sulfur modification protein DndE [Firmicutes bacterium]|nr:DNA sulfur modification protein DndE [Bacillota bacterium]
MFVKQIRLSKKEKQRLIGLKTKTGIQHWNVLCRWALCFSLCESSMPPPPGKAEEDSNVEMSWQTFGGEYHEVYERMIRQRCIQDGLGTEMDVLWQQFRLHLDRGISYLLATNYVKTVDDLVCHAAKKAKEEANDTVS